jgi:hypothetical protein
MTASPRINSDLDYVKTCGSNLGEDDTEEVAIDAELAELEQLIALKQRKVDLLRKKSEARSSSRKASN